MKKIIILFLLVFLVGCTTEVDDTEPGVVYIGFMIHLEGWEDKVTGDVSEEVFNIWAERIRELATLLEEHGAKGTFEARPEFVAASEKYGDNILLELYERGHGIGVHADKGGIGTYTKNYTVKQMVGEIKEMRLEMERVTGLDIRHVSGVCSEADWVKASIDAGYEFTTGNVAMCGLSLLENNLPEGINKKYLLNNFHNIFPEDVEDRINPWRSTSGLDWLTAKDEGLVILSSDGTIKSIYEQTYLGEHSGEFDEKDIETYIESLEKSLELAKADEVNIFYVATSLGGGIPDEIGEDWLEAIEPYVEEGRVEWKTLPEMYDAFVELESS